MAAPTSPPVPTAPPPPPPARVPLFLFGPAPPAPPPPPPGPVPDLALRPGPARQDDGGQRQPEDGPARRPRHGQCSMHDRGPSQSERILPRTQCALRAEGNGLGGASPA